ncbi:MAG TPA: cytochrome b/b6 domain-containing protein [Terriglobia bacterium]|nr:cytochrome b/b6 domain-containing protein [Terriglobia bacterium]
MSDVLPIASGAPLPAEGAPAIGTMPPMAEVQCPRHSALVCVTHWITALAFLALLVTGVEILIAHPRFYWGEIGNVNMTPLFSFHIPSSRASVPTGYGYVLPDQNGWSRYLHFQSAWVLVINDLAYLAFGIFNGHFWRNLFPDFNDLSPGRLVKATAVHLRFRRPNGEDALSYNLIQRLTYLLAIFVASPLIILTGLSMSPAFNSAVPIVVAIFGGRHSSRALFFLSVLLVLFLLVHIFMVLLAGFRTRVGAMITGRLTPRQERT